MGMDNIIRPNAVNTAVSVTYGVILFVCVDHLYERLWNLNLALDFPREQIKLELV